MDTIIPCNFADTILIKVFTMRKLLFLISCTLLYGAMLKADMTPIVIQNGGATDDRIEFYAPADMPEVYIDLDEMEVIIEADGFADYYVVNIISQVTMQSVIYTKISGYGDTVDVSSLPDGYYHLVITSSNNNVFEGYFTIE